MQEITDLFNECRDELQSLSENPSFELGTAELLSHRDTEELKVLFNLARLEIESPEKTETTTLLTSELRNVSAEDLKDVLVATEKAIDVPVISLKEQKLDRGKEISRFLLNSKDDSLLYAARTKRRVEASASQRFISGLADLAFTGILSAALVWLTAAGYSRELNLLAPGGESFRGSSLVSLFIPIFFAVFFIYQTAAFSIAGRSVGTLISGLQLVGSVKPRVRSSQVVSRVLIMPLSLLCLCPVNILAGKECLHDLLSDTRLVRR